MIKISKYYRYLFLVTISLISSISFANFKQTGRLFLTNIKYHNNTNNFVWSITKSSRNTLIIASRKGVLEYNSEEWNPVQTPDLSLKLRSSKLNERIYTCGRNHVGYLKQNRFGKYVYFSLNDSIVPKGVFTDILENDSGVYFYSNRNLLYFNYNDNSISSLKNIDDTVSFLGSFVHDNKLYISVLNGGVCLVSSNTLTKTGGLEELNNHTIAFSCKFDSLSTLIGTQNGKLFLLSSNGIAPFNIEDKEYLQKGIISDGLRFSDSQIAISFKNLGLIIIDKYTGRTTDIIDRENGLPDDYVMALCAEGDQALWLANIQGISRVDVSLPIKNYSSYFGIEGSIITSSFWNKKLYVATSDGVFILDSINMYDTREAYKKIPIVNKVPSANFLDIIPDDKSNKVDDFNEKKENAKEEQKKNRKGFFKRLFDSKEETVNTERQVSMQNSKPVKPTKSHRKPQYEYFQYQQFILKSKQFGFSPLGELKERCSKLISLQDQLLAVTNSDIYSIDENNNLSAIFFGSNIVDVVLSSADNMKIYVIDKEGIYIGIWKEKNWSFTLKTESDINFNITSLAEISEQSFLISLNNQLVEVDVETGEITDIPLANPYSESIIIKQVNEKIYVFVGTLLYKLDKEVKILTKLILPDSASMSLPFFKQPNQLFIKTSDNKYQYFGSGNIPEKALLALKLFNDIEDIIVDPENNIWLINNSDQIYRLNSTDFDNYNFPCEVYLGKIQTTKGIPISGDEFTLKYAQNSLIFSFVCPSALSLNSNQYQYIIEGLMENWSEWSSNNEFTLPYIPAGNYHLKFKARNILDETSEVKSIQFRVLPPFWKTFYFYALLITILIISLYYWQKFRLKRLTKEKEILQQKVKERTEELHVKNKSITDSINYAGRIQKALLPPKEKLDSVLNDHFVYYKPKDIISGDFYFVTKTKRQTVIIAADSTGHGVPGAFMSMLGMAYINDVLTASDSSLTAAEILNKLRDKIITLLHQHNTESRDGMDVVVLLFDRKKNNLQYAGAHNPLYRLIPKKYILSESDLNQVTNENENFYLIQYKANRFQVGNSRKAHEDFTNHVIDYEEDEKFYIFSDGYADQFGGDEERKFMYGRFRKLIISNAHKSMKEQKITLEKVMKEWKRDFPQTDDILIFGMKP